jgi:uncharacterized protein (UPF0335 family)
VIVKCVVIYIQFSISQIVFPTAATIEQENLQSYIERINNALGEERTNVKELRRMLHSTMNEGSAATAERPTLRLTNSKRKNNRCVQGRCRCKDCEGKTRSGNPSTAWVCSACTSDDGESLHQWWLCGPHRPRCWEEHLRAKHPEFANPSSN